MSQSCCLNAEDLWYQGLFPPMNPMIHALSLPGYVNMQQSTHLTSYEYLPIYISAPDNDKSRVFHHVHLIRGFNAD